jgi:hypothetical protein
MFFIFQAIIPVNQASRILNPQNHSKDLEKKTLPKKGDFGKLIT